MLGLANVYTCLNCGEVTNVYHHEHIDCENDKVYPATYCSKCNGEARPLLQDGLPVLTEVDNDFAGYYGDEDREDDDDF